MTDTPHTPSHFVVLAYCRDCGTDFLVPVEKEDRINRTKWYSLCDACLALET